MTSISRFFVHNSKPYAGYAISVYEGSDVKIRNTCFIDNKFSGLGTVEVFQGGTFESENNFGSNNGGVRCQYIAQADGVLSGSSDALTCYPYEATSCQASIYS